MKATFIIFALLALFTLRATACGPWEGNANCEGTAESFADCQIVWPWQSPCHKDCCLYYYGCTGDSGTYYDCYFVQN